MLDAQHRRARAIQRPVTGSQARFANTTQAMPASRSCPEIPKSPSDTATATATAVVAATASTNRRMAGHHRPQHRRAA